ncbi:MAG: PhnD/SsuA/transferrin family substrate-binding protein [Nocardioidaceae bacterium]
MTRQFAISPDVNVRHISDWFILNTRIQRLTGESLHATTYEDFADLHRAFDDGHADLVYANAADTAVLVRDRGYVPIAAPAAVSNEAAVVVSDAGPFRRLEDLGSSLRVAATDAPDVERICRILLEPADLDRSSLHLVVKPNPVLVAKALLVGEVEAAFLPREAFDELSSLIRAELRILISSQIYVVRHCLLASRALAHQVDTIWAGLSAMSDSTDDADLLVGLGAPHGWERMTVDDTDFMIDLMDALIQA